MLRSLVVALATIVAGVALVFAGTPAEPVRADDAPWRLPVRPDNCTEAQALTGDVADCLLYFYSDLAEQGWGAPPAPGVGPGWEWNGYTYSGSPALADWEAQYIRANTDPVGEFGAGYFETHVDAQPLFEGFLDEIQARGYEIRHASAYSFRCTAGSGGWSCPSGNVSGLSLHAWGLAVDMNSDKNPIRSYSSIDGQTACATPIETDMPQWVIQTAEKWGLYWGGYGWSRGCVDTTTPRSSVFRDPPHFEFRGTPEMAQAIAQFNLGDEFAAACFTVVDEAGEATEQCNANSRPEAGWRLAVDLDAPESATAAIVNIAVTESASRGHVTLEDCAPRAGARDTAALTFAAGQTVATMAVVPLSDSGRFCVYSNASVHRIIDVVGYLGEVPGDDAVETPGEGDPGEPADGEPGEGDPGEPADGEPGEGEPADGDPGEPADGEPGEGDPGEPGDGEPADGEPGDETPDDEAAASEMLWYRPSTPSRIVDTRDGAGRVADGREHRLATEPADILLTNLAATGSDERGYLQAGRCGELGPSAGFSSLNYGADETRSNLVFIHGSDSDVCVFALRETHVIVDELGRFTTEPGLGWDLTSSGRLIDTRECADAWCDGTPPAGATLRIPVDTDADALVVALTATGSSDRGYLWAGPCSALDGRALPPTSNLNHAAGATTTNLAIVAIEDGAICVFNRAQGHYVIDVQAELRSDSDVGVVPVDPTRAHDSRDPIATP